MNIVVGLGNPGSEYEQTRHNAGFLFLDELAKLQHASQFSLQKKLHAEIAKTTDLVLAKPTTFMNESGRAVQAVTNFYKISPNGDSYENLFVVHDDLDLELGTYKLQFGTGPKGHNGLLSIYQYLGTQNFWHVRIGVDSRNGDRRIPPHKYVLQQFPKDEKIILEQTHTRVLNELVEKLSK